MPSWLLVAVTQLVELMIFVAAAIALVFGAMGLH